MQELARRFSLSFGLDLVKNREAVAAMHRLVLLVNVVVKKISLFQWNNRA